MQPAASFIAEAWAELAIGICFVGLRLYFRYSQVGLRGMSLDDFLMILAGVHWVNMFTSLVQIANLYRHSTPSKRCVRT
jgi:hypothetical protein